MVKLSAVRSRTDHGLALLTALLILLLISAAAVAALLVSGTESTLVGNQRSYILAWDAAVGGLEEARARLLSSDPSFIGKPAAVISFPAAAGDVLYILNNPGGAFTVNDITNSSSQYYDWEYDLEWGTGALAAAKAGGKIQTLSSDTLSASLAGMLPPLPYNWVRITILTEKAARRDINRDGVLDSTTPVFYDPAANQENVITTSPRPGKTVYRLTSLAVLPSGTASLVQYDVGPSSAIPPFPAALTLCGSSVSYTAPDSDRFFIRGQDSATPPGAAIEAIGTCNSSSRGAVTASIPSDFYGNYTGKSGLTPDVVDTSSTMSSCLQSVSCLQSLVVTLTGLADQVLTGPVSPPTLGTDATPLITVVKGDCSLTSGAGILVVTGTLSANGDASFHGVILVVGQGIFNVNGQGNGEYDGAIFVAKTLDSSGNPLSSLGTSTVSWSEEVGRGIRYHSQYFNTMNGRFPYTVLSFQEIGHP